MLRRYVLTAAVLFCSAMVNEVRGVQEINDPAAFRQATADTSKVYVVKFFATWCGPCKMYKPIFDKFAKEHQNANTVYLAVDVDKGNALAQQYMVRSMPTTVIIQNGRVAEAVTGVQNSSKLESLLKKYAGSSGATKAAEDVEATEDVEVSDDAEVFESAQVEVA